MPTERQTSFIGLCVRVSDSGALVDVRLQRHGTNIRDVSGSSRLLFPPQSDSPPPPKWLGVILTVTSGFTSFVAHAGGPPLSAYVIPLRLSPVKFTATMAAFFFVINLSKWIPYAWLGLLDLRNMATSLVLLPLAPVGVWMGVRLARRISPAWFYRALYVGMFFTGIKLLWDGLR